MFWLDWFLWSPRLGTKEKLPCHWKRKSWLYPPPNANNHVNLIVLGHQMLPTHFTAKQGAVLSVMANMRDLRQMVKRLMDTTGSWIVQLPRQWGHRCRLRMLFWRWKQTVLPVQKVLLPLHARPQLDTCRAHQQPCWLLLGIVVGLSVCQRQRMPPGRWRFALRCWTDDAVWSLISPTPQMWPFIQLKSMVHRFSSRSRLQERSRNHWQQPSSRT